MDQITAIYVRVSGRRQEAAGQQADLKRWAEGRKDEAVKWYRDRSTGTPMDRPGLRKLLADVAEGKVARVVVWRLDRLGHSARGLAALIEDLIGRGVGLVSLKEGLDLATTPGRLLVDVLSSVAAYETEARAERILAGQAAARAAGKTWGGSPKGRRLKVTTQQEATARRMKRAGEGVSTIARATGLSRPTIYRILGEVAATSPEGKTRGRAGG